MITKTKFMGFALASVLATSAFAGELVINTDTSDPAPKEAFQNLIDGFQAENPDITVKWNLFDHEGYKTSIRNLLTADAPDLANWYAGNRMLPFVKAGLFEPVDDVWEDNGLGDSMGASQGSMTIDGQIWGVPYTYYQWGVYYRKDLFAQNGISAPSTWDEFIAAGEALKAAGITPITIGTKYLWTAAGVFDYLNLRTNGFEFHQDLTNGKVAWTDPRVRETFKNWGQLVEAGFFIDNHAAFSWQEALAPMVQGKAAGRIVKFTMLFCLALVAWTFRKRIQDREDERVLWECGAISALILLYSPVTWGQHCVGIFPGIYLLTRSSVSHQQISTQLKTSIGVYVFVVLVLNRSFIGKHFTELIDTYHLPTLAFTGIVVFLINRHRQVNQSAQHMIPFTKPESDPGSDNLSKEQRAA